MPLVNPEDAIKSNLESLGKHRRRNQPAPQPLEHDCAPVLVVPKDDGFPVGVVKLKDIKDTEMMRAITRTIEDQHYHLEEIYLMRTVSSNSMSEADSIAPMEEPGKPPDVEAVAEKKKPPPPQKPKPPKDRRKSACIPCTAPQYKVSGQLARRDVQAVFFAKILMIKVIQLLIINITVYAFHFHRPKVHFCNVYHDYDYLAYAILVAIQLAMRIGVGVRAKWPMWLAFVLIGIMTILSAYLNACTVVVNDSVLIPLINSTLLLTNLMLSFSPYLFRRHVLDKTTNCAAAGLTVMNSLVLIFLNEFETKNVSYGDFLSQVWLPGVLLSLLIIEIQLFETQRILFGLCFNVSSNRWHVAALYL